MSNLGQDLRFGLRMLVKHPAFTAIAIITLALGMGANTAIFSLTDKLIVRSLPVKAPERLVLITSESVNPRFLNTILSYPDFADYRAQNQVLDGLIAFNAAQGKLGADEKAERVGYEMVSENYFDVLGVRAARGRTFAPDEGQTPGAHPVVVLSDGLWQRSFGADPGIVGRTITLNDASFTVIGIAPRGFNGLFLERPTDIWVPLMMRPQLIPSALVISERQAAWLRLMGRLKPGVSLEQAQASLDLLARQIREANTPPGNRNLPYYERRILLEPGGQGISYLRREMGKPLKMLMAIVGLTLLIACVNVATLLLARAAARRKEVAVRLALGASRWRLITQLLTESVLLALLGGGAGLLLAPWLTSLLIKFQPTFNLNQTPLNETLDLRVLAFTLLASLLSGVIFGLMPAWQSSKADLVPALKDEGALLSQRESRWNARHLLIVAQIALAFVVLVGAGLFIKNLRNLLAIDPGYKVENVLLAPLELPRQSYDAARAREFFRQLTERLRALPGVVAVSHAQITPLSGSVGTMSVTLEGYTPHAGEHLGIDYNQVGPGYHELMGIPLVAGRGFSEQDREGAPGVVIINEAMARTFFPDQNPIGKRMALGRGQPWLEIIGVARDIKHRQLTNQAIPHFDLPSRQQSAGLFTQMLIRTTSDPAALLPAVRREVSALDQKVTVNRPMTLAEELNNSLAAERMAAALTSLFALIALLLVAVGLYGVMAYEVTQRTREIGIRMALGARAGDVLRLTIKQGLTLALLGTGAGLFAALALTRLMKGLLYSVSATDPLTFTGVSVLLVLIALLACFIPARRAAQVEPMIALRYE